MKYAAYLLILLSLLTSPIFAQGSTKQVSIATDGTPGGGSSTQPVISSDGNHIAFTSTGVDLDNTRVDLNGQSDVFIRHLETGITESISINMSGQFAFGTSSAPAISADGTWVAYESSAEDLVASDSNGKRDIFIHNLGSGLTEIVSVTSTGVQGNATSFNASVSGDGRFVAFQSWSSNLVINDTNNWQDVFLHDRQLGTTICMSVDSSGLPGDGFSTNPIISGDGDFIAFVSSSSNLVPGDTNGTIDTFVFERSSGNLELISKSTSGILGNQGGGLASITADGRFVAFQSWSTNFITNDTNFSSDVFLHDRLLGTTDILSLSSTGELGNSHSSNPSISANGNSISFRSFASNLIPGDFNLTHDIFMRNHLAATTSMVSVDSYGRPGLAAGHPLGHELSSISADGNWIAFSSEFPFVYADYSNPDIYVRSLTTHENVIVLSGPATVTAGTSVTFTWADGPRNEVFAFLSSFSNSGSLLRGHAFDIGGPVSIQLLGTHDMNGLGTLTGVIPSSFAGSTMYLEVGATSDGNVHDSNMVVLVIL
ncbi:MAG: hypothetical protein COA70_05830 [Planctomycetota bacterium]|nr:MAG: hypothetical protein COA70_05830 [Planctomycetota bacterium]